MNTLAWLALAIAAIGWITVRLGDARDRNKNIVATVMAAKVTSCVCGQVEPWHGKATGNEKT